MKSIAVIAPALVFAASLLPVVPVCAVNRSNTQPEIVLETVHLENVKPSDALKSLQDGMSAAPTQAPGSLPEGIADVTPNDGDNTLTLSGTAAAVGQMKTLLHLFDVKPRMVQVRTRLVEVLVAKDFSRKESVVQASTFSRKNNLPVKISLGYSELQGLSVQLTPHINGDSSISIAIEMTRQRLLGKPATGRMQTVGSNAFLRITRPLEWKTTSVVEFVDQDSTATPGFYAPFYRLEVTAVEVPLSATPSKSATPREKGA